MYIIKIEANPDGSRPALQDWHSRNQPEGYAFCDDEQKAVFYSTVPAGFVDITFKEQSGYQIVDTITANQALADKWTEAHPVQPEPEPEPTQLDKIEAQVTYTAMCAGTLLPEE